MIASLCLILSPLIRSTSSHGHSQSFSVFSSVFSSSSLPPCIFTSSAVVSAFSLPPCISTSSASASSPTSSPQPSSLVTSSAASASYTARSGFRGGGFGRWWWWHPLCGVERLHKRISPLASRLLSGGSRGWTTRSGTDGLCPISGWQYARGRYVGWDLMSSSNVAGTGVARTRPWEPWELAWLADRWLSCCLGERPLIWPIWLRKLS